MPTGPRSNPTFSCSPPSTFRPRLFQRNDHPPGRGAETLGPSTRRSTHYARSSRSSTRRPVLRIDQPTLRCGFPRGVASPAHAPVEGVGALQLLGREVVAGVAPDAHEVLLGDNVIELLDPRAQRFVAPDGADERECRLQTHANSIGRDFRPRTTNQSFRSGSSVAKRMRATLRASVPIAICASRRAKLAPRQ